jgi:hypothetical protein
MRCLNRELDEKFDDKWGSPIRNLTIDRMWEQLGEKLWQKFRNQLEKKLHEVFE